MDAKDISPKKPVSRMTKAELLHEVNRLKKKAKEDIQAGGNHRDSVELLKLEAEKDEWMGKAQHFEEELAKQEAFKKELEGKFKNERKSKNKLIDKLEKRNLELNAQLKEDETGHDPTIDSLHKSSFRLEFYQQGEGLVKGKIEHLISRKKQILKGLEEEKIMDFVKKHIAHMISEIESSEIESSEIESSELEKTTVKRTSIASDAEKEKSAHTTIEEPHIPTFEGELKIKNLGDMQFSRLLNKQKKAQVIIPLSSLGIDEELGTYEWEAQLYSRSMRNTRQTVKLGNYKGSGFQGTELTFEIPTYYIPLGPNRVNASLKLFKINDKQHTQQSRYDITGLAYIQ